MFKPTIKPNQGITIHRDDTISYWSVYHQRWERVSAYALANRHDDYSALSDSDRAKISKVVFKQTSYLV